MSSSIYIHTVEDLSVSFKFNKKDIIINKKTKAKGSIMSVSTDMSGRPSYYVDYEDPWIPTSFEVEDDIELYLPYSNDSVENGPKCECGAKFTSFKSLHATWCPKFEDPSKS